MSAKHTTFRTSRVPSVVAPAEGFSITQIKLERPKRQKTLIVHMVDNQG
jgi:hypothetical protein